MKEDWYTKDIYNEYDSGIKRCQRDDFGLDADSHDFWDTWITDDYQFDLFCPDYANQNLSIQNQKGAMESKSVIFNIEKCVNRS